MPGKFLKEGVDLVLSADVNASSRFIEDQNVGVAHEPLRDDDLLLVAARKGTELSFDTRGTGAELSDVLSSDLRDLPAVDDAASCKAVHCGECGVEGDRLVEEEAVLLAVLGEVADSVLHAVCGVADRDFFTVNRDLATCMRIRS